MLLATAELEDGEAEQAVASATRARRALLRQGRPGLAALADHVIVRAQAAGRRRDRRLVDRAVTCADSLASAGFVAEALDARLTAGLVARQLGQPAVARIHLDAVRAHRDRGPLLDRTKGWHAEVVCRLDDGDRYGARRAIDAGLDAVAALQSLMGATELQVGVAGHGEALARLGLRMSVEDASPWSVLRLLDRRRSASIGLRRLGADTAGDELDDDLAALRAATSRLGQTVGEGDDPAEARRAVAGAEARVRARARHPVGTGPLRHRRGTLGELRSRLARGRPRRHAAARLLRARWPLGPRRPAGRSGHPPPSAGARGRRRRPADQLRALSRCGAWPARVRRRPAAPRRRPRSIRPSPSSTPPSSRRSSSRRRTARPLPSSCHRPALSTPCPGRGCRRAGTVPSRWYRLCPRSGRATSPMGGDRRRRWRSSPGPASTARWPS